MIIQVCFCLKELFSQVGPTPTHKSIVTMEGIGCTAAIDDCALEYHLQIPVQCLYSKRNFWKIPEIFRHLQTPKIDGVMKWRDVVTRDITPVSSSYIHIMPFTTSLSMVCNPTCCWLHTLSVMHIPHGWFNQPLPDSALTQGLGHTDITWCSMSHSLTCHIALFAFDNGRLSGCHQ